MYLHNYHRRLTGWVKEVFWKKKIRSNIHGFIEIQLPVRWNNDWILITKMITKDFIYKKNPDIFTKLNYLYISICIFNKSFFFKRHLNEKGSSLHFNTF